MIFAMIMINIQLTVNWIEYVICLWTSSFQNENLNLLLCVLTIEWNTTLSLCGLNPVIMWSAAPLVCSIVTVQCHHYREYQIITAARAGLGHFQSWQPTFAKISQCPEKNHNQRAAFRIYANQTIHIISYDIWGQQFQFNIYYRILYLDAGLA